MILNNFDIIFHLNYDNNESEVILVESDNKKQQTIRIDTNLFEKIEKLATQEKRSITAQIEYMLSKYMEIRGE